MDAAWSPYSIIFFVFLYLHNITGDALERSVTASVEDGAKKCTTTLSTCKINLNKSGFKGEKGELGEKGSPGDGAPGLPGQKGDMGMAGLIGAPGLSGQKGDKGEVGLRGPQGIPGVMGDRGPDGINGSPGLPGQMGVAGPIGPPGLSGQKGDKGEVGLRGPQGVGLHGPPGLPGQPGVCVAPPEPFDDGGTPEGAEVKFGTPENPLNVACKFAPDYIVTGSSYTFNPAAPFLATCDRKNQTTCIVPSLKLTSESIEDKAKPYKNMTEPFWSSSIGLGFKEIYGLTMPQVMWLHEKATYVKLTLRYHCKNSVPFPESDMNRAVNLLTWSDKIIGPYPTKDSPFHYSVSPDSDKCKDSETDKESWKTTDISLVSEVLNRLPIIDIYIQDIRREEQSFYVELLELCFG